MNQDHRARQLSFFLSVLQRFFEQGRIHIPTRAFAVDEDGEAPFINDGVSAGGKRQAGAENFLAPLEPDQLEREMKRGRARGERRAMHLTVCT